MTTFISPTVPLTIFIYNFYGAQERKGQMISFNSPFVPPFHRKVINDDIEQITSPTI